MDTAALIRLTKGDMERQLKYLNQFLSLVPENTAQLTKSLELKDRQQVKQLLHKMKPQLLFFGLPGIGSLVQSIEIAYEKMPMKEMEQVVEKIIEIIHNALDEVEVLVNDIQ